MHGIEGLTSSRGYCASLQCPDEHSVHAHVPACLWWWWWVAVVVVVVVTVVGEWWAVCGAWKVEGLKPLSLQCCKDGFE
jgi:hypothetical protein